MGIKDFFSFKRNGFFWANILAMVLVLVGLVAGVLKGLDIYTRHGQAVVVPDVKGQGLAQAIETFRARGLDCEVSDSSYVKTLPAGCVLEYKPEAGQKVKEGRTVYLTINTMSTPLQEVPDVADNSSLRQAEARMLALGFKLAENDTIPGELDWVYEVKYQDRVLGLHDKVPVGATLTLVVGNGSPVPLASDSLAVDSLQVVSGEAVSDESWFD